MMSKRKHGASQAEKPLKVGEAATALSTSTRTLRFYEEQGILSPLRTAKGIRLYADEDIDIARVAQHLTALGVALRDIAELATIRSRSKTGDQASHKVFALLEELRLSVEGKKRECDLVLEQIDSASRLVKQCFGCENPPIYRGCEKCPVARGSDKSHLLRLIWDRDRPKKIL